MSTASASPDKGIAKRAKLACKACNARRVKCDIMQTRPCWHCKNRNTPCEPMTSRRGRYPRTKDRTSRASHAARTTRAAIKFADLVDPQLLDDEPAVGPAITVSTLTPPENTPENETVDMETDPGYGHSPDDQDSSVRPDEKEDSVMLFARLADADLTSDPSPVPEDRRTFYLGDAFSLAYVIRTVSPAAHAGRTVPLHYRVPASVADGSEQATDGDPAAAAVLAYLEARGCFQTPDKPVSDQLVRHFFAYIHPAWPVLDRRRFVQQYGDGTLSPMLRHTVYFLALGVCDEALLRRAGFADRHLAKKTYYLRAKSLYDAGFTADHTELTAVLFLLCFWWEKPQDHNDTWHWLGCAVDQAQTLGMHRSTAGAALAPSVKSLWKRIWWSIYNRDRHAAAALGRPVHIRNEDCDVEPLDPADFAFDAPDGEDGGGVGEGGAEGLVPPQADCHVGYVIEMTKVTAILGTILSSKYAARGALGPADEDRLRRALDAWDAQLPPCLALRRHVTGVDAAFWAALLHASCFNVRVLLSRPSKVSEDGMAPESLRDREARQAADAITRINEDLLAAGLVRYAQLHLVPATFAALSIHLVEIHRRNPVRRKLAENRSRQCMLTLSELAKSWPVASWILGLFASIIARQTGQDTGFVPATRKQTAHTQEQRTTSSGAAGTGAACTANRNDSGLPATAVSHALLSDSSGSELSRFEQEEPCLGGHGPFGMGLHEPDLLADQDDIFDLNLLFQERIDGYIPYAFDNANE